MIAELNASESSRRRRQMRIKKFLVALLCLTSAMAFAQNRSVDENIIYTGQEHEAVALKFNKEETRYRAEEVPDTCYYDEDYQTEECGDVTHYRQECRTVPGYEDCNTVYDNVCTNVTRYREECSNGPSREVCSNGNSRQVCNTTSSREVCTDRPTREVCTTRNGRRVCRTVGGGQSCRTIPGRNICRTVPGQRTCHTVAGARSCSQVAYTDQDCDRVSRQQCDWVASSEQCDQIPYSEYECNMVTRTRQVPYECTKTIQVPYQVIVEKFTADIKVLFSGDTKDEYTFNINLHGGKPVLSLREEGNDVAKLLKTEMRSELVNGVNEVTGTYSVAFTSLKKYLADRKVGIIKSLQIFRSSQSLSFILDQLNKPKLMQMKIVFSKGKRDSLVGTFNLADNKLFKTSQTDAGIKVEFTPGKALTRKIRRGKYLASIVIDTTADSKILNKKKLPSVESKKLFKDVKSQK
jgi:hypothetical protein